MLSFIRDNVQSVAVRFIVGIIALVMLFFGVSTYSNQGVNVVATVDGYDISFESFKFAYEREQQRVRQQYRDRAEEVLKARNVEAQVLESLIGSAILVKNAEENGLTVSDLELADSIYNNPAFQTDKRFDREKYISLLENNRLDQSTYEKNLRETLLSQKYQALLGGGISISRDWLEREFEKNKTELTAKIFKVNESLYRGRINVTEEMIQAYYEKNKEEFERRPQYRLQYFKLAKEDASKKMNVREKEISKYYEKNKGGEFTQREKFKSSHILITVPRKGRTEKVMKKAQNTVSKIQKQLKKDPSKFADLAKKYSQDPGSARIGGDLGWSDKGTYVPVFEQALATLNKGEISKPVLSQFGYHIIQLHDKQASKVIPMEEVRTKIEEKIREKKIERRLKNRIAKIMKNIKASTKEAGDKLKEAAQAAGKELQMTEPFDAGTSMEDLGYSYKYYQELTKDQKAVGEFGTSKIDRDGSYIIYEVKEIIPASVKPFEEVKKEAASKAKMAESRRQAEERLKEFGAKLTTLEAFNKKAKELKTSISEVKFKLDDRAIAGVRDARNFIKVAAKMKEGEIKSIDDGISGQGFVVYLEKREFKKTEEDEKELAQLEKQLRFQKSQVLLGSLVDERRKTAEVVYNYKMMEAFGINP